MILWIWPRFFILVSYLTPPQWTELLPSLPLTSPISDLKQLLTECRNPGCLDGLSFLTNSVYLGLFFFFFAQCSVNQGAMWPQRLSSSSVFQQVEERPRGQEDPAAARKCLTTLMQGKWQGLKELKLFYMLVLRVPLSDFCPSPHVFSSKHKDVISLSSCLVIATRVIVIVYKTCLPFPISCLPLYLHLIHFPTWNALPLPRYLSW